MTTEAEFEAWLKREGIAVTRSEPNYDDVHDSVGEELADD